MTTKSMTLRRELLLRAAGAVGAYALPTSAWPQSRPPRVVMVSSFSAADGALNLEGLRVGLRERGYVEGRNLILQAYWGDDSAAQLEKVVHEAVSSGPQVIVAELLAVPATRKAAPALPIVFGFSGDPVQAGLVQSFANPGGNLTGMSYMTLELVGKRMQLLKETLPKIKRIAVVSYPQHPGDTAELRVSQVAAEALGLALDIYPVRNPADLQAALALIEKSGAEALMLFPLQMVVARREMLAQWSLRNRMPTMSGWSQFADGGNLMTYGPNLQAASLRLAYFVDRILKGAKPTDLPVEQPVRIEFVLNAKTAKALGIKIPAAIMLRADRVIE